MQEIYTYCRDYLSPGKAFVTVGIAHKNYRYSSMLHAVFMMVMNSLTSLLPGDGQRKYVQVNAAVNLDAMEKLRSLVEQGKLRVPVDSCWDMKNALKVRSASVIPLCNICANVGVQAYDRILSRRARGKVVVKVQQD